MWQRRIFMWQQWCPCFAGPTLTLKTAAYLIASILWSRYMQRFIIMIQSCLNIFGLCCPFTSENTSGVLKWLVVTDKNQILNTDRLVRKHHLILQQAAYIGCLIQTTLHLKRGIFVFAMLIELISGLSKMFSANAYHAKRKCFRFLAILTCSREWYATLSAPSGSGQEPSSSSLPTWFTSSLTSTSNPRPRDPSTCEIRSSELLLSGTDKSVISFCFGICLHCDQYRKRNDDVTSCGKWNVIWDDVGTWNSRAHCRMNTPRTRTRAHTLWFTQRQL